MKLKRFLINSALLTGASIVTQALGMIFRVYMGNTIGAEAIGLYQLILTVYIFAVTAVTSGITLLVTRLVTEAVALNDLTKVIERYKKAIPDADIYPYNFIVDGVSVQDQNNTDIFPNENFKASLLEIPDPEKPPGCIRQYSYCKKAAENFPHPDNPQPRNNGTTAFCPGAVYPQNGDCCSTKSPV